MLKILHGTPEPATEGKVAPAAALALFAMWQAARVAARAGWGNAVELQSSIRRTLSCQAASWLLHAALCHATECSRVHITCGPLPCGRPPPPADFDVDCILIAEAGLTPAEETELRKSVTGGCRGMVGGCRGLARV